jgi:DNA-binding protein H-NS
MNHLDELIAKKAEIEEKIAAIKRDERGMAVRQAQELIRQFDLTARDLFAHTETTKTRKVLPAKYRDPVSGKTWSGKGRAPKWINGGDRSAFVIEARA